SISCALLYTKPPRTILRKSHLSHLSLDTRKRNIHLQKIFSLYQASMAKAIINLNSWTEVAPAPVMYPRKKPSNSPRLEPIAEEGAEEYDDNS
ncbi:hypothetical protein CMV_027802, partial [Castanea mollissima]